MDRFACDAVEWLEVYFTVGQEHVAVDVVKWDDPSRKDA